MKDYSKKTLESYRPNHDFVDTLKYVLSRIYKDKEHSINDEIVNGLTFEELIGTLLQAKDLLKKSRSRSGLEFFHS